VEGISKKKALSQIFLVEDFVVRILNSSMHETPLSQIIDCVGFFTIEIARCQEKMWARVIISPPSDKLNPRQHSPDMFLFNRLPGPAMRRAHLALVPSLARIPKKLVLTRLHGLGVCRA
jgi:hypothetical protein